MKKISILFLVFGFMFINAKFVLADKFIDDGKGICMTGVISARESALVSALNSTYGKITTAMSQRTSELTSAWTKSTDLERQTARKVANNNYKLAVSKARTEFRKARHDIMNIFRNDARTKCGVNVSASTDKIDFGITLPL